MILGVSRGLQGQAWGAFWTPEGPPWEPFGLHFGCLFSYVFHLNFEVPFLMISGGILGPFWLRFWDPKSTSGALGHEKVDL